MHVTKADRSPAGARGMAVWWSQRRAAALGGEPSGTAAPRCCSSLPFPRRQKGETLCAVVKMILCVCFLQVRLFERCDPGALRSAGLEALWWVCKLDRVWRIWRTRCGRCLHPLELPCLPLWHLTPLVKPVVQVLSKCPTGERWKPLIQRKCNHSVLKLSAFWNNVPLNCIWP